MQAINHRGAEVHFRGGLSQQHPRGLAGGLPARLIFTRIRGSPTGVGGRPAVRQPTPRSASPSGDSPGGQPPLPPIPNSGGGGGGGGGDGSDTVGVALAAWIRSNWPAALGGALVYVTGGAVYLFESLKKDQKADFESLKKDLKADIKGVSNQLTTFNNLYIQDLQARCGARASGGGTTNDP